MKSKIKHDKGQAGLQVLLSVIVMLFVIGLLVMIFTLMGGGLKNATYDDLTAGTAINESVTSNVTAGLSATLGAGSYLNGACGTITAVYNGTVDSTAIEIGNFTQTGCAVVNASSMETWHTALLFNYPYTHSADNTATNVMNDTITGISNVTDWFAIFIVISAMVVLILLTVIIITAIRSSGMIAGDTSGQQNVGTA